MNEHTINRKKEKKRRKEQMTTIKIKENKTGDENNFSTKYIII